jgi:hypothetical protein
MRTADDPCAGAEGEQQLSGRRIQRDDSLRHGAEDDGVTEIVDPERWRGSFFRTVAGARGKRDETRDCGDDQTHEGHPIPEGRMPGNARVHA